MITNKARMYSLLRSGALGNTLRTWKYGDSDLPASMTVRYSGKTIGGSGMCLFNVKRKDLKNTFTVFKGQGLDPSRIVINESAPDDRLLLQGECVYEPGGIYLRGSFERTNMRKAMENAWVRTGLEAAELLRQLATPASYDMLRELMDEYQNHVIEFGIYDCLLGTMPGHNTVIWEVRKY